MATQEQLAAYELGTKVGFFLAGITYDLPPTTLAQKAKDLLFIFGREVVLENMNTRSMFFQGLGYAYNPGQPTDTDPK